MTTTYALVFDRIGTKKKIRRILKQTSILARLRPSKSKDDKNILNHQSILVEGSKDLYKNSKVCVQNKEQGHNNLVKIRVIVFSLQSIKNPVEFPLYF
jgi:hypothetical protein